LSSTIPLTFAANCSFNADVVALFKSIDGRSHDAASRRWMFPMCAHDRLLRSLRALERVNVVVMPLESSALTAMGVNPAMLDGEGREGDKPPSSAAAGQQRTKTVLAQSFSHPRGRCSYTHCRLFLIASIRLKLHRTKWCQAITALWSESSSFTMH